MILLVLEKCSFCEKVKGTSGLLVAKVIQTAGGLKIDLGGQMLDMPADIPGFPALLDGKEIYVGSSVIEERLGVTA